MEYSDKMLPHVGPTAVHHEIGTPVSIVGIVYDVHGRVQNSLGSVSAASSAYPDPPRVLPIVDVKGTDGGFRRFSVGAQPCLPRNDPFNEELMSD